MGKVGYLALIAARIMLGAWMVINGLNHWMPIFPQPLGSNPLSSSMLVVLIETGLFGLVKFAELIGGLMLIFNRWVPLGLVILLPESAVVYYNAAVLQGKWDYILYMGTGCFYLNLILMVAYFKHYLPMLRPDAEMGTLEDLKEIPSIFKNVGKYDTTKF